MLKYHQPLSPVLWGTGLPPLTVRSVTTHHNHVTAISESRDHYSKSCDRNNSMPDSANVVMHLILSSYGFSKKSTGNSNRGYYYFQPCSSAATNRGRLLLLSTFAK